MEYSTLGIDPTRTGQRIAQLCVEKGVTVRPLQTLFGFAPRTRSTAGCMATLSRQSIISSSSRTRWTSA